MQRECSWSARETRGGAASARGKPAGMGGRGNFCFECSWTRGNAKKCAFLRAMRLRALCINTAPTYNRASMDEENEEEYKRFVYRPEGTVEPMLLCPVCHPPACAPRRYGKGVFISTHNLRTHWKKKHLLGLGRLLDQPMPRASISQLSPSELAREEAMRREQRTAEVFDENDFFAEVNTPRLASVLIYCRRPASRLTRWKNAFDFGRNSVMQPQTSGKQVQWRAKSPRHLGARAFRLGIFTVHRATVVSKLMAWPCRPGVVAVDAIDARYHNLRLARAETTFLAGDREDAVARTGYSTPGSEFVDEKRQGHFECLVITVGYDVVFLDFA